MGFADSIAPARAGSTSKLIAGRTFPSDSPAFSTASWPASIAAITSTVLPYNACTAWKQAVEAVGLDRAASTTHANVVNRKQRVPVGKEFNQADLAHLAYRPLEGHLDTIALLHSVDRLSVAD